MDEDQTLAYNMILEGHNICLTGQAGTGKSFVIRKAVGELRKRGIRVALTCSTGIGTTVFESLQACTLHKWAGLEDGRHDNTELYHLIMTDERYNKIKGGIRDDEYLFIDEVSMISSKVLNQVEFICRKVRGNTKYFGNLTVVLSGDFWQLPPVKNELYGDFGHHCVTLNWFDTVFSHRINLNIIHRQCDTMLINAINELERGTPLPPTVAFINSLSRPLSEDMEKNSVYLFARNIDVDLFNHDKVQGLPGQMSVFRSEDEGDFHYINKFLAPKHLGLKIGCPVMLLVNLTEELVNGKIGKVSNILGEEIFVDFTIQNSLKTVKISKYLFSTYDPKDKCILAKRTQYPLKLAYSMTIHKAQGMTLDSVTVDCRNVSNPGQIGVAVGRVRSTEGLCVRNFRQTLCRPHPSSVEQYYKSCTVGYVNVTKNCCKVNAELSDVDDHRSDSESEHLDNDDHNYDDDDDNKHVRLDSDSELSDFDLEVLKLIDDMEMPEQVRCLLNNCISDFLDTPQEESCANFKTETLKHLSDFETWVENQRNHLDNLGERLFPVQKVKFSAKDFHQFYAEFQVYVSSEDFRSKTLQLCSHYKSVAKDECFQFLTNILFLMQKDVIENIDKRCEKELGFLKKSTT